MEKTTTKEYTIKLPSGDVVTVKNIFEVAKLISKTGKDFSEKHLLDNGAPVNEKSLFRILSYLKYLGLIYDTRENQNIEGKEKKTQRWHQRDSSKVADIFYSLKAGRDEVAKEKFIEIIKSHDLYLGIKEELIKNNPFPTELDLENFFRKKNPGNNPTYYQRGIRFVLSLLSFCGLIIKEGNNFKLSEMEQQIPKEKSQENIQPEESNLNGSKYSIVLKGGDLNLQFSINGLSDIDDVETILNILRKKLS
jgi:hypothetical protein